jgi:hypothetical protein
MQFLIERETRRVLFEEVDGDGSMRMVVMPMRLPVAGTMPGVETKRKAA